MLFLHFAGDPIYKLHVIQIKSIGNNGLNSIIP
jgi:hypothetical protein